MFTCLLFQKKAQDDSMKLHIRVFKERHGRGNGRPPRATQKPLSENLAGEVFVGRFRLGGNGKNEQVATGRDMDELAMNIRSALLRSEPGLAQEKVPGFAFRFAQKPEERKKSIAGPEGGNDIVVQHVPLLGDEITAFFRAIEKLFRPELAG